MRGVDDDEVDAGIDQQLGAQEAGVTRAGGRADAQALVLVLGGERMVGGLFHVVHGDEPDAAVVVVHDDELLDAVLVQQAPCLGPVDARPDRHEVLAGHEVCDLHVEIGGEAHVAVGDDADQLAPAVDHRNAGDLVAVLEREDIAQRGVGSDGDRD